MSTNNHEYHLKKIIPLLTLAKGHYQQLVLISGGNWQNRTVILQAAASRFDLFYSSLSLPLSRALLERSPKERPMVLADYMTTLVTPQSGDGVAIDHIEILFDPALHTNPLRLLQMQAHSRLVLASWPGQFDQDRLIYAEPGHPEYYSEKADDLITYAIEVDG